MKTIKNIVLILLSGGVMVFSSCKKNFNDLLSNPNYPNPSTADVDLYLNQVQLSFNNFWTTASDYGAALTRQQEWYGPLYRTAYQPASFDGEWTTAYTGVIKNADALIPLAHEQKKYIQSGIAQALKAYTIATLVDDFGDVPYSEADMGTDNSNPSVDPGADVYKSVQDLLDSAIADFQNPDATSISSDLFYGGDAAKWITFAKTMKLKYYMQERLVDNSVVSSIQSLINDGDLIKDPGQDFEFRYGTSISAPDSRSEHYAIDYVSSGGVGEYIGNYFMWMVAAQKWNGNVNLTGDPRLRYYFYRQALNYSWENQQTCPCFASSQFGDQPRPPAWYPSVPDETPYCVIGKGYLGRDHGDNSGSPPDGNYRTAWGVYPAGGQFDASQGEAVTLSEGGLGAGINPIWQSAFTYFLEAEAASTLGITSQGSAKSLLLMADSLSINKVLAFSSSVNVTVPPDLIPSQDQISSYTSLVSSNYDKATSASDKLNIVMSEYYLALWGNGIESYNNYRRTGMPTDMQIAVAVSNPGFFMRSFFYPSVFVNRNSNAPTQKAPGDEVDKVFWDNNPDNFVK